MTSEFQFIQHIKNRFGLSSVGDDCAVLSKDDAFDFLITTDLLVEDVDFRLSWAKPDDIGHKALAVSVSDVAAMGGTPVSALLSIGVPERLWNSEFVDAFYTGWHDLAAKLGVELIGGDISSAEKLVIDSIVIGEVPKGKAIRRSRAKPGDLIFVSGSLGAAKAGLKLLENEDSERKWGDEQYELVMRQLRPTPQVDLAKQLQTLGIVTSMIDISDGLSSDLNHVCEASRVGAVVEAERLPINPALSRDFPDETERLDLALNGGEDFELLFTVRPDSLSVAEKLPATQIGTITGTDGIELSRNGVLQPLRPGGFQHF
jgi:thiamine-monophosphate kinase